MTHSEFIPSVAALDALQSRFSLRVTACLSEHALGVSADVAERLRFAREQALERARTARKAELAQPQVGVTSAGAAILAGGSGSWWVKLASVLPLVALAGGLMLIQSWQTSAQISVAADIDAALLADDLPPKAYSDAGFVEFLKTPRD